MKILTWNVNGLRAALRKGIWDWLADQFPDVICFQEIRTRPDQLSAEQLAGMTDFEILWNPAQRPGYSGVATLSREKIVDFRFGLGISRFDLEGRLIRSDFEEFTLFNVYFPSGQRGQGRVAFKLSFYAALLEDCGDLLAQGRDIVICGDFNTAHQPIDLRNPRANVRTSGFLPEERAWIDRYLEGGFVDIYRERYPDRVQYTWWSNRSGARERNVGWRLDYYLVSHGLLPKVRDVVIHDQTPGSDHCPVSLELEAS